MKRIIPLLLFAIQAFTADPVCYFMPPVGWDIAQPKQLSSYVQIGFITQGSTDFHPSINLAIEPVDVSQKEYVKIVKEIHKSQPNVEWRDLGKFPMDGQKGELTEITSQSPWGEQKVLQAILVKDKVAYIMTGAVLKQDMPKFQNEILKAFKSIKIVPDLWTPIRDAAKQKELKEAFAALGKFLPGVDETAEREAQWEKLQQIAHDVGRDLGPHWEFLFLKEGRGKRL